MCFDKAIPSIVRHIYCCWKLVVRVENILKYLQQGIFRVNDIVFWLTHLFRPDSCQMHWEKPQYLHLMTGHILHVNPRNVAQDQRISDILSVRNGKFRPNRVISVFIFTSIVRKRLWDTKSFCHFYIYASLFSFLPVAGTFEE